MTNDHSKRGRATEADLQRLAALVRSLQNDPAHFTSVTYAELLMALSDAYAAAAQFAEEHKLTPSPLDYLKDYT